MIIFNQLREKPVEFLSLFLILLLTAILFYVYSFDPHLQRRIIYIAAAAYFLWSLFHHYRRGDLHVSIIIEYLLFSLLAVLLISSTLV